MMESIVSVFEWIALTIDMFGLTLLVLGFARGGLRMDRDGTPS